MTAVSTASSAGVAGRPGLSLQDHAFYLALFVL